jgi:uncharacterized membrane protein
MERLSERRRKRKEKLPAQNQTHSRPNLDAAGPEFSVRLGRRLAGYSEKLGGWTYDFVRHHWLGIVNFHLLVFVIGALEAPLLVHLDQQWIARLFYCFYGFFCHQDPSRSFLLFGNQIAICSRCLAFYSSILVFGLWLSRRNLKPLSLRLAGLLAMPAVLDVLLQAVHLIESTNLIRTTSGFLLGMAVSLYLLPRAKRDVHGLPNAPHRSVTKTAVPV